MLVFIMNDTSAIQIRNPEESNLCSGLYLVPTPVGNLRDITLRALDVLTACDAVICEDSRVTGKLFKAYGLPNKKKIVYNDHAEDATKDYIIALLEEGKVLALVSDAGTPLISDPGYKLVRGCRQKGIYITALPGANAVLPALQLSAMPSDRFLFAGFLPSKDKGVRDVISEYADRRETLVFYESPNRIGKTLDIIAEIIPQREIAVIREVSKLYEESLIDNAKDLAEFLRVNPIKGEIVIVIHGAENVATSDVDIDGRIEAMLRQGGAVKDIAAKLALETGMKKKDVYNRALDIKKDHTL